MINSAQFVSFHNSSSPQVQDLASLVMPDWTMVSFNQTNPAQSVATLRHNGIEIDLTSSPNRVDLLVTSIPDPKPGPPQLLTIELEAALKGGEGPAKRVARQMNATRVALVLAGGQAVGSSIESVQVARGLMPSLPIPEGATEIEYRTNVPVASECCRNVNFNVLHRWASQPIPMISVPMQLGSSPPIVWQFGEVLDINTAQDARLDSPMYDGLFDEIMKIATEKFGRTPF